MAQVKGTLWFDTNIQDTALKTAQRIRQQLEQQFAKQIDVKFNVQGLTDLGSNSGAAKGKIDELTASMNSHKTVVEEMTRLYEQLNKQVSQFSGLAKIGMNAAQQTNRASRESVQVERERTAVYARLNSNMKASIGISGQLNDSLAGLYSVYKAKEFLENVIAIGGQLEQQRVSIAAILHDSAHADDLFNRIKGLALQSPFGVLDLDKYTKQLSAYGFQYNELFDMTKRLADISAGAGTDIGRLALALGHVRSATYLTGITLRQFSMNNIPMLKMLADYYSEVEKRIVTTAEVQKRISARDVGYEEVIEVIRRMTDEGGQFYNMQAVMADTLAGKWKNLKDAIDLMYGSIGESWVGGVLKNTASLLTDLTKHWNEVAVAMGAAVIVFGGQRVTIALTNKAIGDHTAAVLRDTLAQKQQEAERIRAAGIVRQLTASEQRLLATSNQLTAKDVARLMLNKQLTKDEALRAIAMKKLSVEQTQMAVRLGRLSAAEVKQAASMSLMGRASLVLETSLKRLGLAIKSLVLTPAMGWFVGLTAAMEIFFHYQQQAEKSAERVRHALDTAQEGYKNLSEAAEKYKPNIGATLGQDELKQGIDVMIGEIKNYSSQAQNIIRNALYKNPGEKDTEKLQMRSLAEQYDILAQSLRDTTEAYRLMEKTSHVFEDANSETGGTFFWNDSFDKNVRDYISSIEKVQKAETVFLRDREKVRQALNDSGLFKGAASAPIEKIKNYISQLEYGTEQWDKLDKAVRNIGGSFSSSFAGVVEARWGKDVATKELENETKDFAKKALTDLETAFGKSIDKWGQAERLAAQQSLVTHIKSIEGMTDENAKMIEEKVYAAWSETNEFVKNHPFKVDADVERAAKQVSEFQQYLENLVGKDWVVTLKLQKVGSFEELYDQLDKNVKDGKETMRKLRDGLSESERRMAESQVVDLNKLTKKQLEYRDAFLKTEKSRAAAKKEGFKLSADEEKKNKKTGAGSRGGTKKDAELEAWRLRVDALKAFYAEWNSLRKEIGRTGAYEEIFKSGIMPDMFDANGKPKYNLDNYAEELGKMNDALAANTDARKKAKQNLKKEQFKEVTDRARQAAEEAMAELQHTIEQTTRKWDLYKEIANKTGNKENAMQLVFGNTANLRNGIESAKDYWRSMLESVARGVSPDDLNRMSDSALADKFGENWKTVKAYRDEYMKAFRASADEEEKIYLELLEASMTFADKMAKIESQRAKDIKAAKGDQNLIYAANQKANKAISEINLDKLKDEINWDVVFGNLENYTKDVLVKVRTQLKDYLKLNRKNMDVKQIKTVTDAVNKLNKAITKQSGLFGGLRAAQEDLKAAQDAANEAWEAYADAVKRYGDDTNQARDALHKFQEAQNNVLIAEGGVKEAGNDTLSKISQISDAMAKLGKNGKASLSEVGSAVGAIVSALSKSGNGYAQLIAAILSLLDIIGEQGFDNFLGNILTSVSKGVGGIVMGVGNIIGSIFGDSEAFSGLSDMWEGWADYEKAKHEYEGLIATWDRLAAAKQEYFNQSWGQEAAGAAREAREILEAQIKATRVMATKVLGAGDTVGSHSIGVRMWSGSYKYNNQNWQDVAKEAKAGMKAAGLGDVMFESMDDMINMTSEQLEYLMKNYTGLWAVMDDDFREYLEKLMDYYKAAEDQADKLKEKLTGFTGTSLADAWAGTIDDMSKKSEDLYKNLEDGLRGAILNGMISNLYGERIKQLVDGLTADAQNEWYTNTAGEIKQHTYDSKGNVTDTDIAAELTDIEYAARKAEAQTITDQIEATRDMLADKFGWTDDSTATSSASQVLSGLSEADQGLFMSYVNAIRADVSISRTLLERITVEVETMPTVWQNIADQTTLLRNIEANTSRNADSTGAIERLLTRMENGEFSVRVK